MDKRNKTALITGIGGMDGSHLAEFLLEKKYKVYGLVRRSSNFFSGNIAHILDKITLLKGDITDQNSLLKAIKDSNPDEVYNLAAQSFVEESWNTPEQTSDVTGLGVLRILEAIREYNSSIKFYQASSSEMFGRMVENPIKTSEIHDKNWKKTFLVYKLLDTHNFNFSMKHYYKNLKKLFYD